MVGYVRFAVRRILSIIDRSEFALATLRFFRPYKAPLPSAALRLDTPLFGNKAWCLMGRLSKGVEGFVDLIASSSCC